jgi:hypothetical protein
MGIEILAATVVAQVLLPFVKEGAAKIGEAAAQKFGEAAGQHAVEVAHKTWDRVKSAFSSDKDKVLLEEFQELPDEAAPLVEGKLKTKLQEDNQLAEDLDKLVNSPDPDGKGTGAQIIGATYAGVVDLRGGTVSGSNAVITGLSVNPQTPQPQRPAPPDSQSPK